MYPENRQFPSDSAKEVFGRSLNDVYLEGDSGSYV